MLRGDRMRHAPTDRRKAAQMTRVSAAKRRLQQALARLEATVETGLSARSEDETAALRARLRDMHADHDRLMRATDTIEARLDSAIGQLKLVLEK